MTTITTDNGSELTPRQRAILGLVIHEFIQTAEPVGSRTLVDLYELGVSPATVRNEMKMLEELGFLTHPTHQPAVFPPTKGTVTSSNICCLTPACR